MTRDVSGERRNPMDVIIKRCIIARYLQFYDSAWDLQAFFAMSPLSSVLLHFTDRLMRADFTQMTGGYFNRNAGVDFRLTMGDGVDPTSAYDANGNFERLQRWA